MTRNHWKAVIAAVAISVGCSDDENAKQSVGSSIEEDYAVQLSWNDTSVNDVVKVGSANAAEGSDDSVEVDECGGAWMDSNVDVLMMYVMILGQRILRRNE